MKYSRSTCFAACVLSLCVSGAIAGDSAQERRLAKGSPVPVRVKAARLGDVLEAIEKATGNAVFVKDDFGGPDSKQLARTVRVAKKGAPFWSVVSSLSEQTGLQRAKLHGGGLDLAAGASLLRRNNESAGNPVVAGAFLIEPVLNTFFGRLQLRVWPEPRYWAAELKSYAVRWTAPGSAPHMWRGASAQKSVLDGAFELPVSPRFPKGVARLEKLELRAKIAVPLGLRTKMSPSLATMLPHAIHSGEVTVRPVEIADEDDELRVRLEVFGRRVATEHCHFLVAGEKVEARPAGFSLEGRTEVTLKLDRGSATTPGIDDLTVVLAFPVVETHRLGAIRRIRGEARRAGLSTTTVKELEKKGENLKLQIEVSGEEPLLDKLRLVDAKGTNVEPRGHFGGGDRSLRRGGKWNYTFTFDAGEVQGDPERAELVIDAPVSFDEQKVEAFASGAARPWDAGTARVRLLGADAPDDGEDVWRLRLEVEGATLVPTAVQLIGRGGRAKELRGWSTSGSSGRQTLTLRFDVPRAQRDPKAYRLRAQVPKRVFVHTVRATLEDVKIRGSKQ